MPLRAAFRGGGSQVQNVYIGGEGTFPHCNIQIGGGRCSEGGW